MITKIKLGIIGLALGVNVLGAAEAGEKIILFDGKGFDHWAMEEGHEGHWKNNDGTLHYDGKSTAKDKNLWTKEEYGDFTLNFKWRWAEPASQRLMRPILDPATGETKKWPDGTPAEILIDELDSGIYLRGNSKSQVNLWSWPVGSGEVYGYRMDKKMPAEVRAAVTPKANADRPVGVWNDMSITMEGELLTVVLNGKTVIEKAKLPGVPAKGKIALQHHGSAIEFQQIELIPLKK